ncbi:MAG: hypothetical protein GY870_22655 [archaeon]|nr:hypothetical protein [archaeon]
MIDKKVLKTYIIGLIYSIAFILIPFIIESLNSSYDDIILFTLPFGVNNDQHFLFFYLLAIIAPYFAIFLGYGLAYIVVRVYCRLSKFSKKIEFVGYANIDRSKKYLRKRYIIQLIFCSLLCMNIWIYLVSNQDIMEYLVTEAGKERMYSKITEKMFNFPMVPWYWVPLFISILVFSLCIVIVDSGLVTVKKISGQSNFSDTERLGDRIFSFVKGYAGISVILNFIALISTEMGGELSLVLYPLMAIIQLIHLIIAIDLFRNVGRKWIFNAVKSYYPPQKIELNFDKKEIADFKELLDQ